MGENGSVSSEPILIVDDDQFLAKSLAIILGKAGYDASWVETGQKALDKVRGETAQKRPCAVLLDVRLPDIGGLELLREIKKLDPDIGTVMMTGNADTETAVGALNEGAFAYILKPYNIDEVKAIVSKLLEKQKLIRENKELMRQLREVNADLETKVQKRTNALQETNLVLEGVIKQLQEVDETKSRFVAMVSHELKTPVAVIIAAADTLAAQMDRLSKEAVLRYLGFISRDAFRLDRLIKDILDLSRIQERRISVTYKPFDLKEVAETVTEGLKLAPQNVKFELIFAENARNVVSDKDRVQQVLLNLLSNAMKHNAPGGVIKIITKRDGSGVQVGVADSGPGISDIEKGRIFEAFYRTQQAVDKKIPGTGLGLTITKAIIQALGGQIWVESKLGEGSQFIFSLPDESSKDMGR